MRRRISLDVKRGTGAYDGGRRSRVGLRKSAGGADGSSSGMEEGTARRRKAVNRHIVSKAMVRRRRKKMRPKTAGQQQRRRETAAGREGRDRPGTADAGRRRANQPRKGDEWEVGQANAPSKSP